MPIPGMPDPLLTAPGGVPRPHRPPVPVMTPEERQAARIARQAIRDPRRIGGPGFPTPLPGEATTSGAASDDARFGPPLPPVPVSSPGGPLTPLMPEHGKENGNRGLLAKMRQEAAGRSVDVVA